MNFAQLDITFSLLLVTVWKALTYTCTTVVTDVLIGPLLAIVVFLLT